MTLTIHLLGWSSRGMRCPDHEISLTSEDRTPFKVSLIQMPNGTGKTTTLNLLRAALSGKATDWTPEEIQAYRRAGEGTEKGEFRVRLTYGGKQVTIALTLNFRRGTAHYQTTHGTGIENGFRPPPVLLKFLNPSFVGLFVFDGELAQNLLDDRHTKARDAIDALFQLNLLGDLSRLFEENWQRRATEVSATQTKGFSRRLGRLNALRMRREDLDVERDRKRADLKRLAADADSAREEYEHALQGDKNIGERLSLLKSDVQRAESAVASTSVECIRKMRDPHALCPQFAAELVALKLNLDRLKLPASSSREFFEELAQAEKCVCGRAMDEAARQSVRDRAASYLGEDNVAVLNSIKGDIASQCSEKPEQYGNSLDYALNQLTDAVRGQGELETEMRALEERRLAEGDAGLGQKKRVADDLARQRDTVKLRLEELDAPEDEEDEEHTSSIRRLDGLIKEAEDAVAEISHTLILRRQTETLRALLQAASERARRCLQEMLVRETNERVGKLLPRDQSLKVATVGQSLVLEHQRGASVGQTLSVSYAFLATLFNRANHSLPFIVDSPAGALDLNVRLQVAQLIPELCTQFVAFTISSERQNFTEPLARVAKGDVQYVTLFRKTSQTEALAASAKAGTCQDTGNAFVITDKRFFSEFDMKEEA